MSFSIIARAVKTKVGSPSKKAVLIALANHCNDEGKSCFPSQETITTITELSADTVQRALKSLIADGFVKGEKKRKRGQWESWDYEINLDKLWTDQAAPCGTVSEIDQTAPCGTVSEIDQTAPCGTAMPHQAAQPSRTMRHKPVTKPIKQPLPRRPSSADALGALGNRLVARIGRKLFDTWFSQAGLSEVTSEQVTIELPNAFSASRVRQDYEDDVMVCCRSEYPTVSRVRFIARNAAA